MQQNILITGVSSGIGHGLVKHYLSKTDYQPSPEEAAPKLAKAFKQVLSLPSGQYVDVRHL